ncbi:MAG: TIGR03066 family protein [Gemmataceae bacterium]|nr:TIGR03066 family protein [Gemmataceae bacterium]
MNMVRLLAVGIVVGLLSTSAQAEEKKEAKKIDYAKLIVGKWEVSKADEGTIPAGTVVEFGKDGKFKVSGKKDDMELALDGTYKIDGNKFTFKLKIGDNEMEQTISITKLTETELGTKNKEDKVVDFKRKK